MGDARLEAFGLFSAPGGSVAIVPEPSPASLLALGLGALGAARARRPGAGGPRLPPLSRF